MSSEKKIKNSFAERYSESSEVVHFLINAILLVPHSTLANVQCEFHIVRCECKKKEINCVDKRTKAGRCVRSFFFCRQLDFPFRERERER